jgi:hypothetical protein
MSIKSNTKYVKKIKIDMDPFIYDSNSHPKIHYISDSIVNSKDKKESLITIEKPIYKSNIAIISVMINIVDPYLVNYLNNIYKLLVYRNKNVYHVTLFKIFIDLNYLDNKSLKFIIKNYEKIIGYIVNKISHKYNLDVVYTDNNDINNYKILGNYDYNNNFIVKKFDKTRTFIKFIEKMQKLTLKFLFKYHTVKLHSSSNNFNYWTFDNMHAKIIAISKYYNFREREGIIHSTLCKIKEIKNKKKIYHNINEIFYKFISNYINENKQFKYCLYPDKNNELYVTLLIATL